MAPYFFLVEMGFFLFIWLHQIVVVCILDENDVPKFCT